MEGNRTGNLTEYELLANFSLATLVRTMPATVGLITSGSLAFVTNGIIFLLAYKNKVLRTDSHCLIVQLAVADWLVGVSYIGTGVKRLIRLGNRIPETNSHFNCALEMWLSYFG